MSRNRLMLIIAVFAAVIVATGGYFVGVQPHLASASADEAKRTAAEAKNDQYQTELTRLQRQDATLDAQKAELAVLRGSIPSSLSISPFYDELDTVADASSVTISTITMGDATAYTPPTSTDTTTSSTAGSTSTDEPSTSATPTAPSVATNSLITSTNFSSVPVSVSVTGTLDQALDFAEGIQNGERLFLVNNISSSAGGASGATDTSGQMTWTFAGFVYVLADVSTTQSEQASSTDATTAAG